MDEIMDEISEQYESFDEMLDGRYGDITIGLKKYKAHDVLKKCDPEMYEFALWGFNKFNGLGLLDKSKEKS